jgi:uncharacterized protein YkwD
MWEKLKSIIKDFLVKIKVFFPNRNPILPEQDINNDINTKFIENGINHFRIRNYLLKYNISSKLKEIATLQSKEMASKNKMVYLIQGFSVKFGLLKQGVNAQNNYMMVEHDCSNAESILRKLLSTNTYRNILLSDNFANIGVSVYNNYCTVLLTSKF